MKNVDRNFLVLCICISTFFMISCKRENAEIEPFAVSMVKSLNEGDVEAIKERYPKAINVDSFARGFDERKIHVELDKMTNGYKVNLSKDIWLIVVGNSQSDFKIVKSHGLFLVDEKIKRIAQNSGRITRNMDDAKILKALSDTAFYHYLADISIKKIKKYLYTGIGNDKAYYSSSQRNEDDWEFVHLCVTVHNDNNVVLSGNDYKIKVWSLWMGSESEVKILNGIPIPANDSVSCSVKLMFTGSGGTGFDSEILFCFNKENYLEILERYYEPNINDYKEYLNR